MARKKIIVFFLSSANKEIMENQEFSTDIAACVRLKPAITRHNFGVVQIEKFKYFNLTRARALVIMQNYVSQ